MYSSVFCISGPSGSGQDTIIEALQKILPIERLITSTTRAMRENESQGKPYYFIEREKFLTQINAGEFIEYAKQYNDEYYGVSKAELDRVSQSGKIGIWKVDYQGATTIRKLFPEIVTILITVSSFNTLAERIRKRDHATEAFIQERMKYTREWSKHTNVYDYVIYNDNGKLEESIHTIKDIITSTAHSRNILVA